MNTHSRVLPLAAGLLLAAHAAAWAQPLLPPAPRAPAPASVPSAALRADPPVKRPLTKQEREVMRRRNLRHIALLGVSVVLAGGGLFFGARSKNTHEEALKEAYQVAAYDKLVEARRQAIIADLAFGGAALSLAGAAVSYFFFRSPPPPPETPSPQASPEQPSSGPPPPLELPPPPPGGAR
ncbi:hypothetical protein FGE12_08295 [Aggregicoccus sp. 17bor-14]|uniref:hypothetical protein n=1 Tax=Myxococcaceae TaxID=31 RepID=UPI00129C8989|nr:MULTISPECIES: hypothetical protein [Myxococcaceae]MBF5042397.1 hypothetical protein [Simulacricoccus sp. 17bor-14]MRI88169.1 hypothetical protein [Aggregicoccus sp. 17bor-14]